MQSEFPKHRKPSVLPSCRDETDPAMAPALTLKRAQFDAVLFDLDGVLTRTATVHARAWQRMFDDFLKDWAQRSGQAQPPFDIVQDYRRYLDGMPRQDGVARFLESRNIVLPHGDKSDPPEARTVYGLGNRKNVLLLAMIREGGVEVYPSSIALVDALRRHGFRMAVVSSSENCGEILAAIGLHDRFAAQVDGLALARGHLRGKPAPDAYLEAARRLNASPGRAVVVEDAIAGVEAGRAGGFGAVIGVDRLGQAEALRQAGATTVVADLSQLAVGDEGS
jgi:beta-phosphoglucomutase family hydrolase